MTRDQEGEKKKLNSSESQINRGFELMIRKNYRREKPSKPKTFQLRFGKMISLLKREFHFYIEFHLDVKRR